MWSFNIISYYLYSGFHVIENINRPFKDAHGNIETDYSTLECVFLIQFYAILGLQKEGVEWQREDKARERRWQFRALEEIV